jgi:hypothetical protein
MNQKISGLWKGYFSNTSKRETEKSELDWALTLIVKFIADQFIDIHNFVFVHLLAAFRFTCTRHSRLPLFSLKISKSTRIPSSHIVYLSYRQHSSLSFSMRQPFHQYCVFCDAKGALKKQHMLLQYVPAFRPEV